MNTIIVRAKHGAVEVRTSRRPDNRWESEYRFLPEGGAATEWRSAGVPEGFVTEGMALSAAILLGRMSADDQTTPDAAAAM
ncbi:hypothetical protein CJO78_05470 [Ralstonia solanacearum]|nr:hypothetical protein LBM2029_05245 [Ralstonia solanacearum]AXV87906.1 hypothetical protein CJO78_05470 [Ralstonia solanacearum]AXW07366.1 hypothetical protein CJO82_05245 [Ralstonia solanacearum]AXW25152.1 hypothetical protein CJO86_05265 [Ralstonia solanacearum]AXW82064.1 hypothetical protein CJO98_05485 [Ralstonia solanacearum]